MLILAASNQLDAYFKQQQQQQDGSASSAVKHDLLGRYNDGETDGANAVGVRL